MRYALIISLLLITSCSMNDTKYRAAIVGSWQGESTTQFGGTHFCITFYESGRHESHKSLFVDGEKTHDIYEEGPWSIRSGSYFLEVVLPGSNSERLSHPYEYKIISITEKKFDFQDTNEPRKIYTSKRVKACA